MTDDEMLKEVRDQLEEAGGYIIANNYRVIEVKKQYSVVEADITKTSLNPLKIAHGGFIFGLADTAGGVAARTTNRNIVTLDASINYYKPAKGNKLKAVAHCDKDGKTVTFYTIDIFDEEDNKVASARMNYFYLD